MSVETAAQEAACKRNKNAMLIFSSCQMEWTGTLDLLVDYRMVLQHHIRQYTAIGTAIFT